MPLQSRNTGSTAARLVRHARRPDWDGSQIYTTQVYEKWPGDVESYSQNTQKNSVARNFNLQVDFDNGGPFTASVRGIRDTAHQTQSSRPTSTFPIPTARLWPNV